MILQFLLAKKKNSLCFLKRLEANLSKRMVLIEWTVRSKSKSQSRFLDHGCSTVLIKPFFSGVWIWLSIKLRWKWENMSTCQHACVACTSLSPEGSITTTDVLITGGAVNTGPAVLVLALKFTLGSFLFSFYFFFMWTFVYIRYFFILKMEKSFKNIFAKLSEWHGSHDAVRMRSFKLF